MALYLCPKCGNRVSDKASKCPKCGMELSNLYICLECGKRYSKDLEYCPECGCPNEEYVKPVVLYRCSDCGFEYDIELDYCPECGCPNDGKLESSINKPNTEPLNSMQTISKPLTTTSEHSNKADETIDNNTPSINVQGDTSKNKGNVIRKYLSTSTIISFCAGLIAFIVYRVQYERWGISELYYQINGVDGSFDSILDYALHTDSEPSGKVAYILFAIATVLLIFTLITPKEKEK